MNTIAAYVLVLFVHVGAMGGGNSNAITTAEFTTLQSCTQAGAAAKELAKGTVKEIEFVCAKK